MRKIPVSKLKPGFVFSEPVYIDDNNILVPAGVPIRQKDLDSLKNWRIEFVQTGGEPVLSEEAAEGEKNTPSGDEHDAADEAPMFSLPDVQENKGSYRIYGLLIQRLNTVFNRIAANKAGSDSHNINGIGTQLLQAVRNEKDKYIGFILGGEIKGLEMAKSSVNTAILSSLVAQEMRLPHHRILHIIIGALLHDAGMLRLPKEIIDKRGGLSDAEFQIMKSHPLLAHKIVTREMNYPEEVGSIVLQHHERWDGDGYPYRFDGEKINTGARIVSIADAFEAMVSPKPYRDSILPYQAMKNLLADNSHRFDPNILKIFALTIGIYPIGSIVRLNNCTVARVTDVRADAPLRPKLQMLVDENKNVCKSEEVIFIDLLIEKNLFIAKAIDPKEIEN
jgi:HD-GYP domain-containing protein (c-di-GMP phosphodiesterase class II)